MAAMPKLGWGSKRYQEKVEVSNDTSTFDLKYRAAVVVPHAAGDRRRPEHPAADHRGHGRRLYRNRPFGQIR